MSHNEYRGRKRLWRISLVLNIRGKRHELKYHNRPVLSTSCFSFERNKFLLHASAFESAARPLLVRWGAGTIYNFDTWKLLIFQDCSDLIHLGQQSNSLWLKLTILVYPSWGSEGLDDISARYTEGLWTRWQRASERKASCDNYIPFLLHLLIDYKTCSPAVSFNLLKSLVISFHSFLWMNKLKLMEVKAVCLKSGQEAMGLIL